MCHAQLTDIVAGVAYEAYGMLPDGTARVDPLLVHRWAGQLVSDIAAVICHEDPQAYWGILRLAQAIRNHGVAAEDVVAGFSVKFLYLAVYTMAAATQYRDDLPEVQVLEHFGGLLVRITRDLLVPPRSVLQTP